MLRPGDELPLILYHARIGIKCFQAVEHRFVEISHNDAASSSRAGRISNCGRMVAVLMARDFITPAQYWSQKLRPKTISYLEPSFDLQ